MLAICTIGASQEVAENMLDACANNLEMAVGMMMDNETPQSLPCADSNHSIPEQGFVTHILAHQA